MVARFCNRTVRVLNGLVYLGTGESKKCGGVLMYAVIQTGGKQYKVAVGEILKVEKLAGVAGDKLTLDQVLMVKDENGIKIGAPLLKDARITVEVIEQGRAKKIIVYKYKKRKNYRRKQGHRQSYTKIIIEKIEG
jgi:large subunit ribosomal protein L21